MDERPTHDEGTDEVVAQLRRYADAAEPTIPHDLTALHHPYRPRWRPLAAAAVVVALVAGGTFAVLSRDGRTTVTLEGTVPAPLPDPAPDLDDACPSPRAEGPQVDDLRVMLPGVTTTTADTTTDDRGEVDSVMLAVGDDGTEIRVTEVGAEQLAEAFPVGPNDPAATFEICDPFTAEPRRSPVGGYWALGQDERLSAELRLTDGGARGWLVTVSTPLDGRDHPMSEQTGSARAELRRLIAGMSWPTPIGAPRRNDVCANEPVATVGAHQLLSVPAGYTVGEPEVVDTGAVDMGGEQWTRLPLLGPDGAQIDVVSIGTARFTEALANSAVGAEPESLTIQRCRTASGGSTPAAGVEELTELRRSPDRIVVGAQESEYGGWMVIGTGGATATDINATAEALRS